MEQRKTYFITNTLETKFPDEFIYSRNPKYIQVIHCRCIYNDYMVGDVELHTNFIQRNDYFDGFVCYTNTILTKYKKYEYTGTKPNFKIWFTDMDGNEVSVQNFKLDLLLIY